MTDPLALAEEHRQAQVRLAARVQAASALAFDRTLDPRRLDATFGTYAQAQTSIVAAGRTASYQLAAGYYNKARTNSGAEGPAIRVPGVSLDPEQLITSLRVTGPVSIKKSMTAGRGLVSATATARATAVAAVKRHTMNAGRDALIGASKLDKSSIGVARVSDGGPCPFCAMLVSRGPAYSSVATASFRPHDSCGCGYRVVFDVDEDGGWSPDALALRDLWDATGELDVFGEKLALAYADPESAIRQAFTAKAKLLNPDAAIVLQESVAAVTAPEAAFIARVRELQKELPEDRASIGTRNVQKTIPQIKEDLRKAAIAREGKTVAELDDLIVQGETLQHHLRQLLYAMDDHPGIYSATKWPPELTELAKRAGVSRRQPRTVGKVILQAIRDQEDAVIAMQRKRDLLSSTLRQIDEAKDSDLPAFLTRPQIQDDLDELGALGPETARQLAAVREAGQVMEDEIDRRLAARGVKLPDDGPLKAAVDRFATAYKAANDPKLYEAKDWAEVDRRIKILDAAKAERERITAETRAIADTYRAEFAKTAREVLGEVRLMHKGEGIKAKVGNTGRFTEDRFRAMLRHAEETYPADWMDYAKVKHEGLELSYESRGYFDRFNKKLVVSGDDAYLPRVAVHELGHGMEDAVPGLRGLEWAFHRSRTTTKGPDGRWVQESTQDLYGNGKELSYFDDFLEPYSGKSYREGRGGSIGLGSGSYWEIFTTGVESVFESSPYIVGKDGRVDRDFRHFILGVMSVL